MNGLLTMKKNYMGLCNKFFLWGLLYNLSKFYDMKVVLKWPEIAHGALILPNTSYKADNNYDSFIFFDGKMGSLAEAGFDRSKNYMLTSGWDFNHYLVDPNKIANSVVFDKEYVRVVDNLFLSFNKNNIVGLHVRRGDYIKTQGWEKEISSSHCRIPDYWYIDIGNKILKRFPDTVFFLASDATPKEKKLLLRSLPCFCVESPEKLKFLHLLDLEGLSRCDFIVQSHSTFSLFAKIRNSKSVTITPIRRNQNVDAELNEYGSLLHR